MYHMVTVCNMCDLEITGEDYDERHWSEDGCSEYHAWCCPECPGIHDAETLEAMRDTYGWDRIISDIDNKEAK